MIMATAAQADATGEWEALARSVQLHQDPGAAVALVEAVAEAVARFGSLGRDAQGPAHQLLWAHEPQARAGTAQSAARVHPGGARSHWPARPRSLLVRA